MLKKGFQLLGIIAIISVMNACDNKPTVDIVSDTMNMTPIVDIPICNTGDILSVGQMCMDEGTDAIFKVLDDGLGSYTSESGLLYESTDILDTTGTTLNDRTYDFKAVRIGDIWKIEKITSTGVNQ